MRLREFIARLEESGELLRITTPVSTRFEITEITDRISKMEGGGKALLFENTGTDYPVLINSLGSIRRMAIALDVEEWEDISHRIDNLIEGIVSPKDSFLEKLRMLPIMADIVRYSPRKISGRGECQELIWRGDDVDLSRLPILTAWGADESPSISLAMACTMEPEGEILGREMCSMQLFDSKTTSIHWHRDKQSARHYESYKHLGRRMPVSICIGGDPAYIYPTMAPMPDNIDKMLLAGALRQRPVELVKCLTNDIWVASDCDFVLEGWIDPTEELAMEGALGDHTGFYSLADIYPRFHIEAITSRRDAIYPATIVGVPPTEYTHIAKATERLLFTPLRLAHPEVRDIHIPIEGTASNLALVAIDKRYDGETSKIAQELWYTEQMMLNKYLIITPEGTNLRNRDEIFRLLRGLDPKRHLIYSEGMLDPSDHSSSTSGYGAKLAIDLRSVDLDKAPISFPAPRTARPTGGVELFNTELTRQTGLLILYAEREWHEAIDVERYLAENNIEGIKYVALFDRGAAGHMRASDLLWLAAANTEPKRDIRLAGDVVIIDARSKRPGYGTNPKRFPNVVSSSTDTIHYVDERWAEYGIGEMVESPSRRYRKLWLSEGAEW